MDKAGIGRAKLDHVAIGAARIADAVDVLVGRLGGRADGGGPGVGFRGAQWRFANGALIEIIEPDGEPGGFLQRFLAARGPGIHHVTFKVADIYAARDAAEAHGYPVVGFSDQYAGWKELFLHPKQAQGIVIQMAQTDPNVPDETWGRDFPFPRYDGTPAPAAAVSAVRLSAVSRQRAVAQWRDLLGGALSERRGAFCFRWPESPLEIIVEIDSRREEGPIAIEIVPAAGDGSVPERDVRLGTTFVAA